MVTILTEPAYGESMWCKALLSSLKLRLKQKRISFCVVFDEIPKGTDAVFIIAADINWIKATVTQLNEHGIKPILICNQAEQIIGCSYSCVCTDISGSMRYILGKLREAGKTRIALYGVNTSSIADVGRVDGLFALKDNSFDSMEIFHNNGSLEKCYNDFSQKAQQFDAVICFNDFVAVSLIRHLKAENPEALSSIKILSCSQTKISDRCRDLYTSINLNFEQYGKAAVFIYEKLKQHRYISQLTLSVDWSLNSPHDTSDVPLKIKLENVENTDAIYSDKELSDMIAAEKILNLPLECDREIVRQISFGKSISEISQICFMSESNVKYRLKKILSECGISDKEKLKSIVKNYIDYTFENM